MGSVSRHDKSHARERCAAAYGGNATRYFEMEI